MLELVPSDNQKVRARAAARRLGLLRGSMTEGKGNVFGCLGEILVADLVGAKFVNNFDYDLEIGGHRVDVKTKRCTARPRPDYLCATTMRARVDDWAVDYFVFVRILEDLSQGWILGAISKAEFFERATFRRDQEIDPSSPNGWRFKGDGHRIAIGLLRPLRKK